MKLVMYREPREQQFRYFWIGSKEQILSPDFRSIQEAEEWMEAKKEEFKGQLTGIGRPT